MKLYTKTDLLNLYDDPDFYDIEFSGRIEDAIFFREYCQDFQGSILELACGTGRITSEIHKVNSSIVGRDISPAMIKRAKENYPNIHFEVEDMRFTTGNYDLILCATNAFQHLLDEKQALESLISIKAALNPKGRFILDIQNPNWDKLNRDLSKPYHHKTFNYKDQIIKSYISGSYNKPEGIYGFKIEYRSEGQLMKMKNVAMKMYFHNEIKTLIGNAGFSKIECYGDYQLKPYLSNSNKQLFILS